MNPELRRNLWLEFSPHRLIAAPAIIALVMAAVWLTAPTEHDRRMGVIVFLSGVAFVAVVLGWGGMRAGASVIEEVRERTWDAQRMSAIGPWAMTWGKLVGAPAFTWYAGFILLLIFVASGDIVWGVPALEVALILVLSAVFAHAVAFTVGVFSARKGVISRRASNAPAMLILLLSMSSLARLYAVGSENEGGRLLMSWWGWPITCAGFVLGSLLTFCAWSVLGAYRCLCEELGVRTTPWAAPTFMVFLAAWLAGLNLSVEGRTMFPVLALTLWGAGLSVAATYLLLFGESGGVTVWQRLHARWRAGQWLRLSQELPLWLVLLVCAGVFALLAAALGGDTPVAATGTTATVIATVARWAPLAIVLFALRDVAIFQFFALSRGGRRVESATVLYLALLYGLAPSLLSAMGARWLVSWFWPPVLEASGFAVVIGTVHAAIAWGVVGWRWRRMRGSGVVS